MNQQLKQAKQTIRKFLQEHYSDEKLCDLLAHAQSGRLAFVSCCCLIGTTTATHPLMGRRDAWGALWEPHLIKAKLLPGAEEAETAYRELSSHFIGLDEQGVEAQRRRRLISIVKAEIRRREKLRSRSLTYALAAIEADEVRV